MEQLWWDATIWIALALVSSLISLKIGISVALIELIIGILAGNTIHPQISGWVNFLASLGAIVLTFLAGAELESQTLKRFWKESKELASREVHPTVDVVVEDFPDIEYLRNLHSSGFSLLYGLGLPSQSIVFLSRERGFLLEESQVNSGQKLGPLKKAEEVYFRLLWRKFGNVVLLAGSVKEVDIKSNLFCLAVEGGRERWCRLKGSATKALPAVGAKIEVFAWEKWGTQVVEVLGLEYK